MAKGKDKKGKAAKATRQLVEKVARETAQRYYDAAKPSRTTAAWRRPLTSAAAETDGGLPYLRASAHDIVRNNPHGAKIIASLANDAIGVGLMPRANTGKKRLNKLVDELATEFFSNIDADGITHNYAGFQQLAARALFEGGEAVFRRYLRPSSMKLAVPLQFALLEGEYIDNTKNFGDLEGNQVSQGIEFDPETRVRVAYYMFREHPGDIYGTSSQGAAVVDRVPADDVRIMFEPQRPGQRRGTPWITPILVRAKLLDDYEDAERQRKRIESSIPAVVKNNTQIGDASDSQGPSLFPTMTDAAGNVIETVEAGMLAYLKDSAGVEFLKPADAIGFAPYKRAELQSIAAGARSTYELTSGDLSQTSFSSIQFGTLSYRNMLDVIRATVIIPQLEWIWRCFIDRAVASGKLPDGTPYGVEHHCPPWLPIDPVKAAEADKIAIRTGTKSLYEVVTASGKNFEEHIASIAQSNKLLDRYDVVLDSDPRMTDLRGVFQSSHESTEDPTNEPEPAASAGDSEGDTEKSDPSDTL